MSIDTELVSRMNYQLDFNMYFNTMPNEELVDLERFEFIFNVKPESFQKSRNYKMRNSIINGVTRGFTDKGRRPFDNSVAMNILLLYNEKQYSREDVYYKNSPIPDLDNVTKLILDSLCGNLLIDDKIVRPLYNDYKFWNRENKVIICGLGSYR